MSEAEPAADEALRVDFYVLEGDSTGGRLKLACRVAEKAYLAGQSVLIWHTDAQELAQLDVLLWTFSDRAFVPHERLERPDAPCEAPVRLLAGAPDGPAATAAVDIIINLAAEMPPSLRMTRRVAEILDGDPARRQAGRARFKAYRELGASPATHSIKPD
jgi:DNA polymerase-3 subunit chi